jgi:hypothetical protein
LPGVWFGNERRTTENVHCSLQHEITGRIKTQLHKYIVVGMDLKAST